MKQSGHLNPSEETGTGCPVTSKCGMAPPNRHGGVSRQQQHSNLPDERSSSGRFHHVHAGVVGTRVNAGRGCNKQPY